jgi:SAM-dependent methyltransferase
MPWPRRKPFSMTNPPPLFDQLQIARNRARRVGKDNFVRDLVLDDLADRLSTYKRDFAHAVLIGPDPETLPPTLFSANGPIKVQHVDAFVGDGVPPIPGDEYDLIISLLHLQAVDDVPGHLARLRRMLKPDGLLMAAFVGGESLTELREAFLAADIQVSGGASARVAPMAQVRDAGALLQRAGFALPVADVETHRVRYSTPFALMAELKALGASNPLIDRPRRFATRGLLAAAASAYAANDADPDGRIRATLEIIWIAGWVPHESQQKPLKPGSATMSMKDVLSRTDEKPE